MARNLVEAGVAVTAGLLAGSPSIRDGEPVFRGTRVAVSMIAQFLEQGIPRTEILEDHPALDEDTLGIAPR